jgi:hypothetical protein
MHPHTSAVPGMPTEPQPIAQVNVGMTVVDVDGERVGVVAAVQQPGTDVRPDLAAGDAENLMGTGYAQVDGTGFRDTDVYVGGHQVAGVTEAADVDGGGVVTLSVPAAELHRVL